MARLLAALIIAILIVPTLLVEADAQREKDQALVNIENFKFFRIEIKEDEKVRIDARIETLSYPVSVFLIKGQQEFDRFVASDSVNVDEIKGGNISDFDDNFTVIADFSDPMTALFKDSITIGEADLYFLVIMLYRDSTMDPEDVLTTRATLVNYDIEWRQAKNDVPYYLVPLAILAFLVGAGLLMYYFWPRGEREPEEVHKTPTGSRGRTRSRP
jgi:hypothetical protein